MSRLLNVLHLSSCTTCNMPYPDIARYVIIQLFATFFEVCNDGTYEMRVMTFVFDTPAVIGTGVVVFSFMSCLCKLMRLLVGVSCK